MTLYLQSLMGLLFSIIPVALVIGPAAIDISISLMAILFIILSIYNKDYKFYKSKFIFLLIVWNLYLILTSLLSENILLSLESSLFYFRFSIFSLSVWYLLENKFYFLKIFFWVLLITFILIISDSFYQVTFGENILGHPIIKNRISSFFREELVLGSYFSRLFPLFFGILIFLYPKNLKLVFMGFIVFIILDVLIYMSGERSALFYLFLSTIFILIFMKEWKILRISSIVLSLIIIVSISFINSNFKERVVDYTYNQIFLTDHNTGFNFFSPQHQVIYKTAYKIFIDHPIIGIGPKNFRYICQQEKYKSYTSLDRSVDGCQTSPANYYLQILAETGLVGLLFVLFFIWCFISVLNTTLKKNNSYFRNFLICLLACSLIPLWPFIPTGSVFNNWISVFHYLPIGMILYAKNRM